VERESPVKIHPELAPDRWGTVAQPSRADDGRVPLGDAREVGDIGEGFTSGTRDLDGLVES
jgi:hypothetical protein